MKLHTLWAALVAIMLLAACNNGGNQGNSTPIDSTNVNGTAPATYGGDNPRDDTNRNNIGDTGTTADNVHNTGH